MKIIQFCLVVSLFTFLGFTYYQPSPHNQQKNDCFINLIDDGSNPNLILKYWTDYSKSSGVFDDELGVIDNSNIGDNEAKLLALRLMVAHSDLEYYFKEGIHNSIEEKIENLAHGFSSITDPELIKCLNNPHNSFNKKYNEFMEELIKTVKFIDKMNTPPNNQLTILMNNIKTTITSMTDDILKETGGCKNINISFGETPEQIMKRFDVTSGKIDMFSLRIRFHSCKEQSTVYINEEQDPNEFLIDAKFSEKIVDVVNNKLGTDSDSVEFKVLGKSDALGKGKKLGILVPIDIFKGKSGVFKYTYQYQNHEEIIGTPKLKKMNIPITEIQDNIPLAAIRAYIGIEAVREVIHNNPRIKSHEEAIAVWDGHNDGAEYRGIEYIIYVYGYQIVKPSDLLSNKMLKQGYTDLNSMFPVPIISD